MTATRTRSNKYAANCTDCSTGIPAGAGHLVQAADGWIVRCADAAACGARLADIQSKAADRAAQLAADPGVSGVYTGTEEAALAAVGITDLFDPRIEEALAAAGLAPMLPAVAEKRRPSRRTPRSRGRRACVSGGNCSSTSGRDCGGHDCDAN